MSTKLGFASTVFAGTAMLNLYCRSSRLREAQQLFDEMPEKRGVTWSTLIYGHTATRDPTLLASPWRRSPAWCVQGVSSVLVACARMEDAGAGAVLHSVAIKYGICGGNVIVGTALVDMYAKCHDMPATQQVFQEMEEKNVSTYTAIIGGFASVTRPRDAMVLVKEMEQSEVAPNMMTYSSLLSSFANPGDLDHWRQAHCAVLKKGLKHNPYVPSTLMTMYSRCGSLEGFRKVQMAVSWQDQVSLNSVISGLSSLGLGNEAFEQFLEMRRHGADTDLFTFASMLKAIGSSSSLLEGRQVHALILNTGHDSDVNVQNGLISMYARRGEIGESQNVFASVQAPGLISWSSLLSGYAQHGCGKEAVEVFEQMRRLNVHLDHTTFLLVLTACSHTGLVDQGLEYFNLMRTDGFLAGAWQEQYACVVDLLARAGRLREAEFLVTDMPIETSVSVYRSLLSACQIHGNLEIAVRVSARLIELCPDDASGHVQLCSVVEGLCW